MAAQSHVGKADHGQKRCYDQKARSDDLGTPGAETVTKQPGHKEAQKREKYDRQVHMFP